MLFTVGLLNLVTVGLEFKNSVSSTRIATFGAGRVDFLFSRRNTEEEEEENLRRVIGSRASHPRRARPPTKVDHHGSLPLVEVIPIVLASVCEDSTRARVTVERCSRKSRAAPSNTLRAVALPLQGPGPETRASTPSTTTHGRLPGGSVSPVSRQEHLF